MTPWTISRDFFCRKCSQRVDIAHGASTLHPTPHRTAGATIGGTNVTTRLDLINDSNRWMAWIIRNKAWALLPTWRENAYEIDD